MSAAVVLETLGSLVVGYCLGMVLTADIVCRAMTGKSAFGVGDGNPGMANVGHELGTKAAVLVLAGDCAKVVLACVVSALLFGALPWSVTASAAGLGATLGHNYPAWHRFHGGKGVATTCAAIILIWPAAGVVSSLAGLATVVLAGYLCWGAVAIPAVFALFCLWRAISYQGAALSVAGPAWFMFAVAVALLAVMVVEHGPAIRGISRGETPRASLADKVRSHF